MTETASRGPTGTSETPSGFNEHGTAGRTEGSSSGFNEHSVAAVTGLAAAAGGGGTAMQSGVTPQSTTAALASEVPKVDEKDAGAATISGVTPQSTTAGLAGSVPKDGEKAAEKDGDKLGGAELSGGKLAATVPDEPEHSTSLPGAFPDEPVNEPQDFGVKPIPASEGIGNPVSVPAGEKVPDPSTISSNAVDSTATTSKEGYEKDASAAFPVAAAATGAGIAGAAGAGAYAHEKRSEADSFGVNPIPASSGIGNPISVPAGEKLPEQGSFNPNTVQSTVTTSKEGYEKDASASLTAPAAIAGAAGAGAAKGSAFSVPEKSKNMIPESSLPMGGDAKDTTDAGPFISSAAPKSSSYNMASTAPLEPKRQGMVVDEDEAPSATLSGPAPTVPEFVKESLSEAHQSPEAAGSAEAVDEKALMENELLKKVKSTDATGESAPSITAAGASSAPVSSVASNVPAMVKESMSEAHQPAEAAAAQEVVNEKRDMESELLREVKPTDAVGNPAPTAAATAAATSETAPEPTSGAALGGATAGAATLASPTAVSDAPTHAAPFEAATPGVESLHPAPDASHSKPQTLATTEPPTTTATTAEDKDLSPTSPDPNAPATPATATTTGNAVDKTTPGPAAVGTDTTPSATTSPASTATKDQKKKNRRSFFGKLKDRLKDL